MCGLAGFIDFSNSSDMGHLKRMVQPIHHRGPDDEGLELLKLSKATVGLGFRRLSIIDLSTSGHQPMFNPADRCWITFNGEVYNFEEVKEELLGLGHSFVSESDTEVILKSYQQWGIACVDRFRGMFAIVLLDPTNDAMYLVRDRAGVKPLYYYKKGSYLLFGSELKSFHQHPGFKKELDPDATSLYFRFGYVPAPHCIFKDAFKVKPGHFLKVDLKDGTIDEKSYWNAFDAYNHPRTTVSYEDALEKTEAVLSDAFRLRMVSDVPVGLFLSGGYDSTCVAALLQKEAMMPLNTYTIGFEEKSFNEADHARQVASHLGTNHHEHICTHKEALDIVPALAEIYDEPFGDSSAVPTILVSRFARHHVKVALSADAGDELFAGYPRHAKNIRQLTRLSFVPGFVSKSIGGLLPRSIPSMVKADRYGKLIGILSTDDPIQRFMITNEVFTFRE
ncbi:MAG: asparagine synthase (glutamine-hydrolyzing), partial [Bacteroidota bacterium]